MSRVLSGEIGVQIFFTISGFIITHLLLREHSRTGGINLRSFWYRRAWRILPPLFVLLAVVQLFTTLGFIEASPHSQWASLFFFRNHVQGGWFNGHLWSLSVEEQFYLGWPLVTVWILGSRRSPPLWTLILAAIVGRSILLWKGQVQMAAFGLIGNADPLLLGCWGAWHFSRGTPWPARFFEVIARSWPVVSGFVMLLSFIKSTRYAYAAQIIEPALVGCLAISLILAHATKNGSMTYRVLNAAGISQIGRMSYSLYLWQQLFLSPPGAWNCIPPWAVTLPSNLLFAALAGLAGYALVELPSLSLKRYCSSSMRTARLI
jgi:peptidoglycan/LPS O-acetylase OafA/YrhL